LLSSAVSNHFRVLASKLFQSGDGLGGVRIAVTQFLHVVRHSPRSKRDQPLSAGGRGVLLETGQGSGDGSFGVTARDGELRANRVEVIGEKAGLLGKQLFGSREVGIRFVPSALPARL
jgi:hypothetical protein